MATAPSELSTITNESAARPSIWRRIAERPYAPETLLLYSAMSFFFLGRNLIGHFSDRFIGMGHDPASVMFFLEWWRYALAGGINPFNLTAAWYPPGYNLALTTPVPLAALATMPIDATLGPVAAYNVAILCCPALSAWSAFLLCRYITRSYWPSFIGGYIFGFSSYMLAHSLGHLTLTMVFLLPPAVYLILLWFANELTDKKFISLLTLVLLGQFLSSLEVLAAMTLVGAMFLLFVWCWADETLRARIFKLIPLLLSDVLLFSVLVSPYLFYLFRDGSFPMVAGLPGMVSAQPLSLFVPVSINILGGWKTFRALATAPNLWEAGEYIGIPLFLIFCSFARERWTEVISRALVAFFVVICVGTFGPWLKIGGKEVYPLPWQLITYLPVVHVIIPARISVYLFLDLAIIAAIWLNDRQRSFGWRAAGAVGILVSLLPNLLGSYWTTPANIPPFFSNGIFREYLSPGETVLVLPYGFWGDSDAWLAETGMYFRMAGGYVGIMPPVPPSFDQYPIVADLYNLVDIPDADEQMKCFLAQKHINAVIVAEEGKHLWRLAPKEPLSKLRRVGFSIRDKQVIRRLFSGLGVSPIHIGGVSLYRVPLAEIQAFATIPPRVLQRRVAAVRLATLIVAGNQYFAYGYDPKSLTPLRAQQLGLLPPDWIGGIYEFPELSLRPIQDELLLSGDLGNRIGVGVLGPKSVLAELAREYSSFAAWPVTATYDALRTGNAWLFPPRLRSPNPSDTMQWVLLLEFQPDGLARAAKMAESVLVYQAAHPLVPGNFPTAAAPMASATSRQN